MSASSSSKLTSTVRRNWVSIGVATTAIVISTYALKSRRAGDANASANTNANLSIEESQIQKGQANQDQESQEMQGSVIDVFKKNKGEIQNMFNGIFTGTGMNTESLDSNKRDNSFDKVSNDASSIFQDLSNMIMPPSPKSDENFRGNDANNNASKGATRGSLVKSFASLITGEISEHEFTDMIHYAQNMTQRGDVNETRSGMELVNLFYDKQEEVKTQLANTLGSIDVKGFDPTSMFYYLEHEDEQKNPSWKRRKHRYFKGVDVSVVRGLNDALHLAEISYLDSIDEIRSELADKTKDEWELVYAQLDSLPEKPSHYLAIKKGQSRWSQQLEVLMVVRGTKTITDMLTDALMDDEDYRDGKAHAGILRSGKNLVEKHEDLMQSLLDISKKKRIKLKLVGHSLGAGAAAVAGMEFKQDDKFDVEVVGFGCPAILSKELSESTEDYITTVIGDADVVPRMSAETIGNLMLNLMEYDWTPKARRDIEDALQEVKKSVGFLIQDNDVESVMKIVDKAVEKYIKPGMLKSGNSSDKRLETILYPPGSCVHFYRDGVSISGSYVPCDFFNEIDVARTMVDDHLISRGYRRIFLELERSERNDDHFSFDDIPQ
jgi:hypothetical protein